MSPVSARAGRVHGVRRAVDEKGKAVAQGDVETLAAEGSWHNVIAGTDQVSEAFDTQEEAVEEGRAMARDLGVAHIVKNVDGSISDSSS